MGLNGIVFMVIGAIMVSFSYFVNMKTGNNKLFIFYIVGAALILIGIGKLILNAIKKPAAKSPSGENHFLKQVRQMRFTRFGLLS